MRMTSHNLQDKKQVMRPEVTIFCAVWHKQENKLELLRSHWENLKQQTIPVEPCYIFDNGDTAPDWLDAPWHSFSEPLTIYEAWSAAAALTGTRYVMNLNMDDRLAVNGAEILLHNMKSRDLSLVGGEWHICFDSDFQTEPFSAMSADDLQFLPSWPPQPCKNLRLGSGKGERGTFGPATMWDLKKTTSWYPCYFGNRKPILSIGDSIFWTFLQKNNHKTGRVTKVIGRYYSSPNAQAEFRPHNDHGNLKESGLNKATFGQMVSSATGADITGQTMTSPRNKIEAKSHALAQQYLSMFGHSNQTPPVA